MVAMGRWYSVKCDCECTNGILTKHHVECEVQLDCKCLFTPTFSVGNL